MKEHYLKVKADAMTKLGALVGYPIDDSAAAVHAALADALKRGTYAEAATAVMCVQSWNWAVHELDACEAKAALAK